jgi:hypothetical protein
MAASCDRFAVSYDVFEKSKYVCSHYIDLRWKSGNPSWHGRLPIRQVWKRICCYGLCALWPGWNVVFMGSMASCRIS